MGTCIRRKVGCVLVTEDNRILSTGYNGPPSRWPHCDPASETLISEVRTCPGAATLPPGLSNNPQPGTKCVANHAEKNALRYVDQDRIHAAYLTLSPCFDCLKMLLNTPLLYVVFEEEYVDAEEMRELWTRYTYSKHSRMGSEFKFRHWLKYSPGLQLPRD